MTNPFLAMPFPGAGGAYRIEDGALVADTGNRTPRQQSAAPIEPVPAEADTGETTPPRFQRRRNRTDHQE